jgi:predicted transglutaminase-like cysteine proteinase
VKTATRRGLQGRLKVLSAARDRAVLKNRALVPQMALMLLRLATAFAFVFSYIGMASAQDASRPEGATTASVMIGGVATDDRAIESRSALHRKVAAINNHYNASFQQDTDARLWGVADYWATPEEFAARGAGDCEDFAIAKYFHLLREGIAEDSLRLLVAYHFDARTGRIETHMVLAWFASAGESPLVLDNLSSHMRPLSDRLDLAPRFAFNRNGWWTMTGWVATRQSGAFPMRRWSELLERTRPDGTKLASLVSAN